MRQDWALVRKLEKKKNLSTKGKFKNGKGKIQNRKPIENDNSMNRFKKLDTAEEKNQ